MKFTVRDVLNTVFRYSRALVLFWIVVLTAALVFYTQTNKLYDSKATILISLGTEVLGKADYLNGKNMMLLQREQQIHNEQQILQSHEVALTAAKWIFGEPAPGSHAPAMDSRIDEARHFLSGEDPAPTFLLGMTRAAGQTFGALFGRPQTQSEKVENIGRVLSDGLSVKAIFDSDALDVSFRYHNPDVAQTVLRLLIDAYLQHHIAVFQNNTEADLLKAQLEHSIAKYHDELGQFSSFMTEHRVYNDDVQVNVLIEQREKLKQGLNEALADGDAANARLASLTTIQESLHQFDRYSTTEVRNRQRDALLAKLDDAAVEERTLLTRHPKESRAYQEEQSKLDELRHLLEKEPEQVVQETEQRKSKASEFVESEVISVTEMLRGDQARADRLRGDLQNINSEIDKYATDLKGFNALKLDLTFAKQESEQMAQVYVGSRLKTLTSQSAITDISVIDVPTRDPLPASPNKKIVLAATILLLIAGSFAVLLAGMGLGTTLADSATAELQLGVPVAGTIPVTRRGPNEEHFPDVFTHENYREFARIYRSIRERGPEGKIILLTESGSKEGVSLVGYGLSRFLSRTARQKTAFVDRTTHPVMEFSSIGEVAANEQAILAWPGAGEQSRGGRNGDASEVVLVWPSEDAGASGDAGDDVVSVLLKLRREFAYVVLATGAVKNSTDLLMISGIVSAVFFIVEAGKTRRATARYSLDLLQRYGFQNIRLILNKRVFYIPGWLMRFV